MINLKIGEAIFIDRKIQKRLRIQYYTFLGLWLLMVLPLIGITINMHNIAFNFFIIIVIVLVFVYILFLAILLIGFCSVPIMIFEEGVSPFGVDNEGILAIYTKRLPLRIKNKIPIITWDEITKIEINKNITGFKQIILYYSKKEEFLYIEEESKKEILMILMNKIPKKVDYKPF